MIAVLSSTDGCVHETGTVDICEGGQRGADDRASCIYTLQSLLAGDGAVSSDAAAEDALDMHPGRISP